MVAQKSESYFAFGCCDPILIVFSIVAKFHSQDCSFSKPLNYCSKLTSVTQNTQVLMLQDCFVDYDTLRKN